VTRLAADAIGPCHRVTLVDGGAGAIGMVRRGSTLMEEPIELSLRDLFDFVRRGLVWALLAAAVGGLVAFALTSRIEPTYRAMATLVATHVNPSTQAFGNVLVTAPSLDAGTYRTAILSRAVTDPAAGILAATGVETGGRLGGRLSVATSGTTSTTVIRLEVLAPQPELAARIANAVATAAIEWDEGRATRSLETIIVALQSQIAGIDAELASPLDDNTRDGLLRSRGDLSIQLSSARALRNAAIGRLEPLEAAVPVFAPVAPRPVRNAVTGALLAAVLVYAVRFLRQVLDVRVPTVDALTTVTGLPVLTEFPLHRNRERRLSREAASYLRMNLMFDLADVHPKVILVTGYSADHGKTSVAVTLAESFAAQGHKTLLMDADLRRPTIGAVYQLDPDLTVSLRDALTADVVKPATEVRVARETVLDVYPSFTPVPNPTELLGNRLAPLLRAVKGHYDVVILDSAPLLAVADTLAIAPLASAAVMVVSMREANRRSMNRAIQLLRRANVPVLGLVANMVSPRGDARRDGYGYGYGYGDGADGDETTASDTTPSADVTRPPPRKA